VTIKVESVLDERAMTQALDPGATVDVYFHGSPSLYFLPKDAIETLSSLNRISYLQGGDERLFFLDLRPYPYPKGPGR
jgi:hypothetical protein